MNELFLLPNQLVLFFLDRLGLLSIVAGDPGRSDLRLSDDDNGRKPRNLRTELGRLLPVGLVGERVLLFPPLEVVCWSWVESVDSLGGGVRFCGNVSKVGVGCESRGPLPGVGGRGVSGGESSGAGIEVPSVSEKLMGVSVSGWYFPPAILIVFGEDHAAAAVNGEKTEFARRAMAEKRCRWG
jgi:hypothetical protein